MQSENKDIENGQVIDEEEINVSNNKDSKNKKRRIVVCTHLDKDFCGQIVKSNEARSEIELMSTSEMVLDGEGLIHSGYLYSSAAYAALVSVNNPNAIIISSEINFLAPIGVGNKIIIRAEVKYKTAKKNIINITAKMLDLEIMDGTITIIVSEKHPLSLNLTDTFKK